MQFIAPYSDEVKFDDILPNVGLTWRATDSQQLYLSYAEGLSAPRTDNLYSVVASRMAAIGSRRRNRKPPRPTTSAGA